VIVDDYSLNIGAVDQADQLRSGNPNLRRVRRGGWRALFNYLFNTVLVNSWILATQLGGVHQSQVAFRTELLNVLFKAGTKLTSDLSTKQKPYFSRLNKGSITSFEDHKIGTLQTGRYCVQCSGRSQGIPGRQNSSVVSGRKRPILG
jgi:hypothetical protein